MNISDVLMASIVRAMMMEAVCTSETSVNFYKIVCTPSQKTVIFILTAIRT
jgi:hypothetical protein